MAPGGTVVRLPCRVRALLESWSLIAVLVGAVVDHADDRSPPRGIRPDPGARYEDLGTGERIAPIREFANIKIRERAPGRAGGPAHALGAGQRRNASKIRRSSAISVPCTATAAQTAACGMAGFHPRPISAVFAWVRTMSPWSLLAAPGRAAGVTAAVASTWAPGRAAGVTAAVASTWAPGRAVGVTAAVASTCAPGRRTSIRSAVPEIANLPSWWA